MKLTLTLFLNLFFLLKLSYGGNQFSKIQEVSPFLIRDIDPITATFELCSTGPLSQADIQSLIQIESKCLKADSKGKSSENDGLDIKVYQIQCLNLSGSKMGDPAALTFFQDAYILASLAQLVLMDCLLQTEAAKALAKVLKSNTQLKWVDLSCNQIEFEGATALTLALLINPNSAINTLNFKDSRETFLMRRSLTQDSKPSVQALTLYKNSLKELEKKELQKAFFLKGKISLNQKSHPFIE